MAGQKKVRIDFGEVDKEIRGRSQRSTRVPEGDYIVKIQDGSVEESERSGSSYIRWKLQIVQPATHSGKTLYANTSLKKAALFNLRNLIHAATGKNVAGRALDFDPEKVFGRTVGCSVEDNEYPEGSGKVRSQVQSFFPEAEAQIADEEETEVEDETEYEEEEDLEEVEVDEL